MSRRRSGMTPLRFVLMGGLLGCLFSCDRPHDSQAQMGRLPEGVFAQVADQVLRIDILEQLDEPQEQAQHVVQDALLAERAREQLPHRRRSVERAVLGRALVERIEEEIVRQNPPSEEFLARQRRVNWMLFDRPRAVRVGEVAVPVPEMAPEQEFRDLADRLHDAAKSARHLQDVLEAIDSIETEHRIVRRRVPPVAEDGRVVPIQPQDREYDRVERRFARAVARLQAPGDVSEVFATEQGFSFAYAIEVIPALRPSDEEVREQLIKQGAAPAVEREMKRLVDVGLGSVGRPRKELGPYLELVWRRASASDTKP